MCLSDHTRSYFASLLIFFTGELASCLYRIKETNNMATRFDSKEYARNRIFNLCAKYFPRDQLKINSGRKGFRLGDSTLALIDRSKVIIDRVKESNETIPRSTVNVFRYGLVCQEIFTNQSSYQVISQLKSRSRRGHRKELELVDFDHQKVELKFKKSSDYKIIVRAFFILSILYFE